MTPIAAPRALAVALVWLLAACEAPITYQPASVADEAEVGRPSFTEGDEFWFTTQRDTFVEVYEGEEDGLLLFRRGASLVTRAYTPDLSLAQIPYLRGPARALHPGQRAAGFSAQVGKTWERVYRTFDAAGGPQVRRTRACQVAERGVMTVPAGTFEVLRIDCSLSELGVVEVTREQVFYAPEVGRIILRRTERRGDRERLYEYTRAAPSQGRSFLLRRHGRPFFFGQVLHDAELRRALEPFAAVDRHHLAVDVG